jgi:hypothetical protein
MDSVDDVPPIFKVSLPGDSSARMWQFVSEKPKDLGWIIFLFKLSWLKFFRKYFF